MKTVILGAGGYSKVILDTIQCINMAGSTGDPGWRGEEDGTALLDDRIEPGTKVLYGTVKGPVCDCYKYKSKSMFVIAVGDNYVRKKIAWMYELNYRTLIHPASAVAGDVIIGEGTVIMPGAVINSGSRIGRHCIINTGATIDHDCVIHDFVHISPGAHLGGAVEVGDESWIGIGSCVKNNIVICADCRIGAGAAVVSNIISGGIYVGVPAKKVRNEAKI